MPEPSVSGRYMAQFMGHVDALPPAERDAVRAQIGDERLARMASSRSMFAWLPVDDNLVATRAVAAVLGPRRTAEFFRTLQVASLALPFFSWTVSVRPLVRGNPTRALGWVAKGYGLMFKAAGRWEVTDVAEGSATLKLVDVPDAMLRDAVWIASVASSLHAIFEVTEVHGAVTGGVDAATGAAAFRFRWA